MENKVIVKEEELRKLLFNKLTKAGYPDEQAQEIANHLTFADSVGLFSHGSLRAMYNIVKLEKGGVNINPNMEFIENSLSSVVLEADNANGMYAVNKAVEYGIAQAQEKGIYLVSIKNMTHSGTMSYYVRKIAANNLIGITMCSADPQVLPVNGKKPYFGTNPIAYAIPTKNDPVVFDMATSVQAFGKIYLASVNNETIPDHWGVDEDGNATTDPKKVMYVLPMSGPKGYGLGLLVDVLSSVLTNLDFGQNIKTYDKSIDTESGLGQFMILINPAIYSDINTFLTNMSQMVSELHEIEPYDINKKVLVPGESSKLRYDEHRKKGIPISKKIYDYLIK